MKIQARRMNKLISLTFLFSMHTRKYNTTWIQIIIYLVVKRNSCLSSNSLNHIINVLYLKWTFDFYLLLFFFFDKWNRLFGIGIMSWKQVALQTFEWKRREPPVKEISAWSIRVNQRKWVDTVPKMDCLQISTLLSRRAFQIH